MNTALDIADTAVGDLTLLAYAMHMAETARSDPAKRLFEKYVELERRRLQSSTPRRRGRDAAMPVVESERTGARAVSGRA